NQQGPGETRQERVDALVRLLVDEVGRGEWRETGGSGGSIRELSGQLIVTQSPENQRRIAAFLDSLRARAAAGRDLPGTAASTRPAARAGGTSGFDDAPPLYERPTFARDGGVFEDLLQYAP